MAEEELAEAIELEDETEEIPDNFVDQMASRIGIILQREMDPTVGATEVTKYIYETTYPNKVNYFIDAMEMLHESHTTDKYAGPDLVRHGLCRSPQQGLRHFHARHAG